MVDHRLAFRAMEGWRVAENPPRLKHERVGGWLIRLAFQVREGWRVAETAPSLETREGGVVVDHCLAFRAMEGWQMAENPPR